MDALQADRKALLWFILEGIVGKKKIILRDHVTQALKPVPEGAEDLKQMINFDKIDVMMFLYQLRNDKEVILPASGTGAVSRPALPPRNSGVVAVNVPSKAEHDKLVTRASTVETIEKAIINDLRLDHSPEELTKENVKSVVETRYEVLKKQMGIPDVILQQDSELLKYCVYESLLYLAVFYDKTMGSSRLLAIVDDVARPSLGISKKKHNSIKSLLNLLDYKQLLNMIDVKVSLLQKVNESHFSSAEDYNYWKKVQYAFLHDFATSEIAVTKGQVDTGLLKALEQIKSNSSLEDIDLQTVQKFLQGQKFEPFNFAVLLVTQCVVAAMLDCDHHDFNDSWNRINSPGESNGSLASDDTFYFFECYRNWIIGPEQKSDSSASKSDYRLVRKKYLQAALLSGYTDRLLDGYFHSNKAYSNVADGLLSEICAIEVKNSSGISNLILKLHCWVSKSFENAFTVFGLSDVEAFDLTFRCFFKTSAYLFGFKDVLRDPSKLPLPARHQLVQPVNKALRKFHENYFMLYQKKVSQITTPLLSAGSGFSMAQFDAKRDDFRNFLALSKNVIIPSVSKYLSKHDVFSTLLEPQLVQLRAEVAIVFDPLAHQGSIKRTLDQPLILALNDLDCINGDIYNVVTSLLDVDHWKSIRREEILLIDLESIAKPLFVPWLKDALADVQSVIFKILSSDGEKVENSSYGISSSPTDIFQYIKTIVDIYFSLPYSPKACDVELVDGRSAVHSLIGGCKDLLIENMNGFCSCIVSGISYYAQHVTSPSRKIDLNSCDFELPRKTKSKGDRKMASGFLEKLFIRINNICFLKEKLAVVESIFSQKLSRISGVITSNDSVKEKSFGSNILEIFLKGQQTLNQSLMTLLKFTAKYIVFVELRDDFINGLYQRNSGGDITGSTLQGSSSPVRKMIDEIFMNVYADRALLEEKGKTSEHDSLARHLLLCFYIEFLEAYEAIVVLNAYSGRKFETKDTNLLLEDQKVIVQLFSEAIEGRGEMLNPKGLQRSISPLKQIVTTLFPVETSLLIKAFDKTKEDDYFAESERVAGASNKSWPARKMTVEFSMQEIITELEKDQQRTSFIILEQERSVVDKSVDTKDNQGSIKVLHLKHDIQALVHDLPELVPSKNPFYNETSVVNTEDVPKFNPWKKSLIFNVIARRGGFGNPEYFNVDASSIFNVISNKQGSTAETQTLKFDKEAFLFLKKHGIKRWFDKNIEKAESLITRKASSP